MTPKRWIIKPTSEDAQSLASSLGMSPVIANLLIARGCHQLDAARAFLKPSLDQLHDPFLMQGMSEAVARVLYAIDHQEPVLIYGDYDVDGTTGTAVLHRA